MISKTIEFNEEPFDGVVFTDVDYVLLLRSTFENEDEHGPPEPPTVYEEIKHAIWHNGEWYVMVSDYELYECGECCPEDHELAMSYEPVSRWGYYEILGWAALPCVRVSG